MNKASITSLKEMSRNQVTKDIVMTPLQRLDLAFQISDFAVAFSEREPRNEDTSSIQWIELLKVSTPNERNTR